LDKANESVSVVKPQALIIISQESFIAIFGVLVGKVVKSPKFMKTPNTILQFNWISLDYRILYNSWNSLWRHFLSYLCKSRNSL